jgi:FF domain
MQELLREANLTGDTTWEQARPLLELNPTFAALPEAERRLAFDAAVAEKKRQVGFALQQ